MMRFMLSYFRHPFPSRRAFGPYASPGLMVHLPFMLICLILGWALSGNGIMLPIILLCVLGISLYLGRDLAIQAHYNVLITVGVFAGLLSMLSWGLSLLISMHAWARTCPAAWPGWVFVMLLCLLISLQIRRHQQ